MHEKLNHLACNTFFIDLKFDIISNNANLRTKFKYLSLRNLFVVAENNCTIISGKMALWKMLGVLFVNWKNVYASSRRIFCFRLTLASPFFSALQITTISQCPKFQSFYNEKTSNTNILTNYCTSLGYWTK